MDLRNKQRLFPCTTAVPEWCLQLKLDMFTVRCDVHFYTQFRLIPVFKSLIILSHPGRRRGVSAITLNLFPRFVLV